MRIKQMSDLHLEFDADFFPKNEENADILMLNGDICMGAYMNKSEESPYYHKEQQFLKFFDFCSKEYEYVLYTPGNHEYYRGHIDTIDTSIRTALAAFDNIHYLNNNSIVIDDITFLAGTLWTDMNKNDPVTEQIIRSMMNDFRLIAWKDYCEKGYKKFTPGDAAALHRKTLKFFDEASVGQDNVVIMSHHAPSYKSVHPKYHKDTYMNHGYFSDLEQFILDRPQIKLWTHGHMHDCFNYDIGDTKVICNPRGYKDENPNFSLDQIIEI